MLTSPILFISSFSRKYLWQSVTIFVSIVTKVLEIINRLHPNVHNTDSLQILKAKLYHDDTYKIFYSQYHERDSLANSS